MSDTSGVDPQGGLDTSVLMKGWNAAMSQYQSSKTDLDSALAGSKSASEQQQFGITSESQAQADMNLITGAAAAKQQADNKAAAAHFGTNPDAASYVLASLGDQIIGAETDISQRRSMIDEKVNQDFVSNPLQWIMNQFTLPMDVYAANLKISDVNRKLSVVHELEQATREQFATNAVLDQADAVKVAEQQNQILAARAVQEVAKSQQEAAKLGIQGITVKAALTKDQNDSMWQMNNALAEKEKIGLEIQKAPYYIAAKEAAIANTQEILAKRQNDAAETAMLQDRLQKAGSIYGMAPPTVQQLKMMQGPMRGIWEQLIISQDTEEGRLASTPAIAVQNANKINAPLTEGMNDTRGKLMKMMALVREAPEYKIAKPEEQIFYEDQAIAKTVQAEARNIPQAGSVYSPLSLNKMIAANPVTAGNPLAKELAPLALADKNYAASPDDVFKAAFKLIERGDLTPATASDAISELYRTMQNSLNQAHQYQRFALPRLSDQTGYRQSVWMGGGFMNGGVRIVDMTNSAAIENALTRSIISRKIGTGSEFPALQEEGK